MKLILISILSLFIVSCAHHHEKPKHHHHKYDRQCAYSISHGKLGVKGKEEFKTTHSGKTYYFSSKKKQIVFENDLEKNITNADKYWSRKR